MNVDIKQILLYLFGFLLVNLLDAWSTVYVIEYLGAEEVNPYVDPSSMQSLLFSQLQGAYFVFCMGAVIGSEMNSRKTSIIIRDNKFILFVFCLPYFYLITKFLIVANNIVIALDFYSILSWYLSFYGEYDFFGLVLLFALLAMIFLPICEKYLLKRFKTE
ncbi:MAG: hypothetical protein ACI9FB_003827 [Candidatus Azotimanducaceae bacterium]|jgi:hypothetical protein